MKLVVNSLTFRHHLNSLFESPFALLKIFSPKNVALNRELNSRMLFVCFILTSLSLHSRCGAAALSPVPGSPPGSSGSARIPGSCL